MVDDKGKVLSRLETATEPELGYAAAIDRVEDILHQVAKSVDTRITGIGIGSTGPVDPLTGEIGLVNFFPNWKGANPVADLTTRFAVTVAMENDADAAALAEASWGAGKGGKRLIYVTVGTGIGTGLIFDGHLYRGVNHAHPEIGHHVIDPSGPRCFCGFRGCWESLAAGPAMAAWLEEEAPRGYPNRGKLTGKLVCELALKGDEWATKAVERETYYLGLGLANLVTIFVPDSIVLSGGVMQNANLFLDGIHKIIRESCGFVPFEKTKLALASMGTDTNLIGAARVWHHRFGSDGGERAS
jgi:glucokinase